MRWLAGAVVAACAALPARAGDGLALRAGASRIDYDSTERFDSGAVADREQGRLSGREFALTAGDAQRALWLRTSDARGDVNYLGATQIGLPIATLSALHGSETTIGLRAAHEAPLGTDVSFEAGWGLRRWQRRIAPTPLSTPLTETLRWQAIALALGLDRRFGDFVLHAELPAQRALRASLDADFAGVAAPVTVHPGGRWTVGAALGAEWQLLPNAGLALDWRSERRRLGGSETVPYVSSGGAPSSGGVRYPGSTTWQRQWGLALTLRLP